jgi:hypothetical protein
MANVISEVTPVITVEPSDTASRCAAGVLPQFGLKDLGR